jgi:hypothetical protein
MNFNDFCIVVIAYLYIDSWMTAFRLRGMQKKIEELQKALGINDE